MSQAPTAKLALQRAEQSKTVVRVFYGDSVTGKDDCDETNRKGRVHKTESGAFVLTPCRRKSKTQRYWIHTIDTRNVVRIARYTNGACKPVELYRHPAYTAGEWSSYYRYDLGKWVAVRNGLIHATFGNEADAALYVDYIQGNRARHFSVDKVAAFKRLLKRKTT